MTSVVGFLFAFNHTNTSEHPQPNPKKTSDHTPGFKHPAIHANLPLQNPTQKPSSCPAGQPATLYLSGSKAHFFRRLPRRSHPVPITPSIPNLMASESGSCSCTSPCPQHSTTQLSNRPLQGCPMPGKPLQGRSMLHQLLRDVSLYQSNIIEVYLYNLLYV